MNLPEAGHPQRILCVLALHCQCISIRVQHKSNFCKSNPLLEGHLMLFPKFSILFFCLAMAYKNSVLSQSLVPVLRIR